MNSGMSYGIFGCNRNELRNKVWNCWHEGPEATENRKRNLNKGLCSQDTFGAAMFGGLRKLNLCNEHPNPNLVGKHNPKPHLERCLLNLMAQFCESALLELSDILQ